MAPTILKEFTLPCDIETFMLSFWMDVSWYERFLVEQLEDLSVTVSEWSDIPGAESVKSRVRNVNSYHPSKVSFPGLPSHAESIKTQTYEYVEGANLKTFTLRETNTFRGIPYADYFNVNTDWFVKMAPGGHEVTIAISLDVVFHKSTWLQGTIQANTKAELMGIYELWQTAAEEHLKSIGDRSPRTIDLESNITTNTFSSSGLTGTTVSATTTMQQQMQMQLDVSAHRGAGVHVTGDHSHNNNCNNSSNTMARISSRNSLLRSGDGGDDGDSRTNYTSDDDLQYYDCEDVEKMALLQHRTTSSSSSTSITAHMINGLLAGGPPVRTVSSAGHPPSSLIQGSRNSSSIPTAEDLHALYMKGSGSGFGSGSIGAAALTVDGRVREDASARDVAVTVVETVFVLAGFTYWKIHRFYMHDLKLLFTVEPTEVVYRVANSFVPGWHGHALVKPDLYGPLIAVFLLPLVLLLAMGGSRHGCNQAALLGNAVVVSLCLWCGLSTIYRVLAFVIAPTIEMKHCLCVTGYSFFAWVLAILGTYPLDQYSELFAVPVALPLVLFGIPSALAQGSMFWEHTAASSLTLQPTAFPSSLRQCAQQHNRILQKVLWAVPKIAAFIVVSGTHYQFLWYVARFYLPGKKELCQLSVLVQPGQYADILTQKELRKYAIMLLSGKKLHGD